MSKSSANAGTGAPRVPQVGGDYAAAQRRGMWWALSLFCGLCILVAGAWASAGAAVGNAALAFVAWPAEVSREEAPPTRDVLLDVLSSPEGAQVFVDGIYVGTTPARGVLVPRPKGHQLQLELRRAGWESSVQHLRVGPSERRRRVVMELEIADP